MHVRICAALAAASLLTAATACAQTRESVEIRGRQQWLYVYGSPSGEPVIVSSGDGGWIHLGPQVAEFLSSQGYFVLGFDVRAYLSAFTNDHSTLRADEEPRDFQVLTQYARQLTGKKPILIGVSEGAALSVLAATDGAAKGDIAGIIALGLPDVSELGWRWRDAMIYLTHRVPREPTFSTAAVIDRVAPVPLAAIHSTHDEFVPVEDVQRMMSAARQPKRLWIVDASNHRFSSNIDEFNRRLLDALAWLKANAPR